MSTAPRSPGHAPAGSPVVAAVVTLARATGPYDVVSLAVPPGPAWARARPGQFVVLPGDPASGRVLPEVVWLADVTVDPVHGTTVDLVRPQGHGWVSGQSVRLLGPLGRGFPLPAQPVPTLLVGHELASVPVRWLVPLLRGRGCPAHLVLSAEDPDHHLDLGPLRRAASSVVLTTPTELARTVERQLEDPQVDAGLVLAAGPRRAMREVASLAAVRGLASRVCALDPAEPVVCGTGICGQCELSVPDGPRGSRRVLACLEGPVVPGEWLTHAPR